MKKRFATPLTHYTLHTPYSLRSHISLRSMSKVVITKSILLLHGRPLSMRFVNSGSLIQIGHVFEAKNLMERRLGEKCPDTLDALTVANVIIDGSRGTDAKYARVFPSHVNFYK